jgi:hypothetical protein
MVVFFERPDEVGSLSCLVRIFVYTSYMRLEFISVVILFVVVYPMPWSDFPHNRIGDHTGA